MVRSISLIAAIFSYVCYEAIAFQPIGFHRPARNVAVRVSSEVEKEAPIIITGRNIELTPALVDYVNKRIGGPLKKLASNGAIRECDVHLSVSKNPKVRWRRDVMVRCRGSHFLPCRSLTSWLTRELCHTTLSGERCALCRDHRKSKRNHLSCERGKPRHVHFH